MDDSKRSAFHDILEACYDVQLELEELGESYEILISDIELVLGELSENLERIRSHLSRVEVGIFSCSSQFQQETQQASSIVMLQD